MATGKTMFTDFMNDGYFQSKEIDAGEVLQLLKQAEAIPQNLMPFKGCIHVIDYTQRRHLALSGQPKNMIGYDPEEVMNSGLDFIIDIFHKDDFKIFNETVFPQVTDFLKKTPHNEHPSYVFSFTYRMRKSDGKWMQIYQQGSYITDIKTHLPLYGIGMVTDISPFKKDTCMLFTIDKKMERSMFSDSNVLSSFYYPDPEESRLSRREREVVARLAEGCSSKMIAERLCLSESTIVNHRKNILKKTNTKNVAQLIRYVINKGII